MATGIFNVAVSGLNAAQTGLLTTSHNISNASTPGYNRQQILQTTNTPMFTGAGFIGQGTNVETIQRVYSQYLSGQLLSAQTGAAEMDSYQTQVQQIDNLLADPNAGMSPALSDFFKGVQAVAANPSDTASRQSMLSSAQELVGRFQSINQRLQEIRDGVNSQVTSEVGVINSYAQQLAQINQKIVLAQAAGSDQPPNDLLDQRDQLLSNLNKEIRVSTLTQSDGTMSVFVGNGQPLVIGTQNFSMRAVTAPDDPARTVVALLAPNGASTFIPEAQITGGTLGGLVAFRAQSLDQAQNALGQVAIGLAQTFNDVHRLGQDLTGALGGQFFNVPAPIVNASSSNASQATLLSAQIINSDYRVTYNSAGGTDPNPYKITRLSDGTNLGGFAGLPQYVDGVQISQASGTPLDGDVFLVKPENPPSSRVIAESDNTGTAVLNSSGSNVQALTTSDYRLEVSAAGAGPSYSFTLIRLSDNQSWTGTGAGATAALAAQAALADLATRQQVGFSLSFSGTAPALNDTFVIEPTRAGARDISVAVTDPSKIAAAAPIRTAAALANQGTAVVSAGSVDDKSYLPLNADVTLTFNSNALGVGLPGFVVAGAVPAVSPIAYNPATATSKAISFNGLALTISGTPKDGDVFTVSQNANGVSDNRTVQLLGNLQTLNTLAGTPGSATAGATASFQAVYAQLVSSVGNTARQVQVTGQAQQTLADQAKTSRDQLSGVNLDEEAANLLRYQQAYQASAKIFDIAGKLFDQILALNG